ncbi:MAG: ADP-ribosylglycohydrolase family protein [Verrucomicrobiales bacterium]
MTRRAFCLVAATLSFELIIAEAPGAPTLEDRMRGLLIGSLIGDAAGGPVEFQDLNQAAALPGGTKLWREGERLTDEARAAAARRLTMLPYAPLRPEPEPYAHWRRDAAPGTLTDDSRHKIVLLDGLRRTEAARAWPFTTRSMARAYAVWRDDCARPHYRETETLCLEWLAEFGYALAWLEGDRDPARARPPERLWNGLGTCCGQMTSLPLALLFPGQADEAYRAAWHIGFFDNGQAKDLNAALVGALAAALTVPVDQTPLPAWEKVFAALLACDPWKHKDIPWCERAADRWLRVARAHVAAAQGEPARLFRALNQEFAHTVKWEAQVPYTLLVATVLLAEGDPLAAMQLAIEWGHDTDSDAQMLGAFAGALFGWQIFPEHVRSPVEARLQADYGESVDAWLTLCDALRARVAAGQVLFAPE